MKQHVKALSTEGECFVYWCTTFSCLGYEQKINAGVFDGSRIRKLMRDQHCTCLMNDTEKRAENSFVAGVKNCLGNKSC